MKCKKWTGGLSVVCTFGIPPMMCAWQVYRRHAGLGGGGGGVALEFRN